MWHGVSIVISLLGVVAVGDLYAQSTGSGTPVVVFVHGRGQLEQSYDQVQARFLDTFRSSQLQHFGAEVVPRSAERFVWYADAIDPKSTTMPSSPACKYASSSPADAAFSSDLRRKLIRIGQSVGLSDAALYAFAQDTHKYLTKPDARCEADARLSQALLAPDVMGRPLVVVAHSMGGIVAFSAFDKLSTTVGATKPTISRFITIGTQVGVTEILQGLQGSLVTVPVPVPNIVEEWSNFLNEGDLLAFSTQGQFKATNPIRMPEDLGIMASGGSHAIETYLGNADVVTVIANAWCGAFRSPAPKECALADGSKKPKTTSGPALQMDRVMPLIGALSIFFDVDYPAIPPFSNSSRTGIFRVGDGYSLLINENELHGYQRRAGAEDFNAVLLSFLAHEFAHIGQGEMKRAEARRADSSIVMECEADIWAAAAYVNVRPIAGNPAQELAKLTGVIGAVAESGSSIPLGHSASSSASHPDAAMRALCAARGFSAGMNMLRARQLAIAGRKADWSSKDQIWNQNPDELGPTQDPWGWSLRSARQIARHEFVPASATTYVFGHEEMKRLAAAAEGGPAAMLSAGVFTTPSPLAHCEYFQQPSWSAARCAVSALPSDRLVLDSYENTLSMLSPVLLSRGWERESIVRSSAEHVTVFRKGRAKAMAKVDLTQRKVMIEFESRL